ncbi:MAG: lysine transporter LysE [Dehalococcoidia bacterium]|nr:lysine transporter LysE [Dehalococcoidia bacterium]
MPDPTFLAVIFITSFVVGLSGALQPGPLLMINIAEVAKKGFWAGPLLVAGHGIAELFMVLLLAFGASVLFQAREIAGAISIVGGAYLIWMGAGIVKSIRHTSLNLSGNMLEQTWPPYGPVLTGMWASVTNPGWLVWWATIGASYVVMSAKGGVPALVSFYAGHILSDLSWYSLVAAIISSGRRILTPVVYKSILSGCGPLLLVIGGYFFIDGVLAIGGG